MPVILPPALVNVKTHCLINCILAALLFIFQIASLASAPFNPYEQIGIGFWGAIVIAITAVVSFKASATNAPFLLGCSFVLATFSCILSFSILGIFAAAVDSCYKEAEASENPDACTSARLAFDAILIICGILGIPVNGLLIVGIVSAYEPPSTPAA